MTFTFCLLPLVTRLLGLGLYEINYVSRHDRVLFSLHNRILLGSSSRAGIVCGEVFHE